MDYEDDTNVKNCALSKRRTAHTVAEQKRRDAIKVINVVYLPDFN